MVLTTARAKGAAIAKKARSQYFALRRKKALQRAPGRRVFVDCGANTCTVLRSFVDHLPGFEFFAFEAQPELQRIGRQVMQELVDAKIEFIPMAVWTENTVIDLYLATKWGPN